MVYGSETSRRGPPAGGAYRLTMAEYFRDEGRDVRFFVDNIYATRRGPKSRPLRRRILRRWASSHSPLKWARCRNAYVDQDGRTSVQRSTSRPIADRSVASATLATSTRPVLSADIARRHLSAVAPLDSPRPARPHVVCEGLHYCTTLQQPFRYVAARQQCDS